MHALFDKYQERINGLGPHKFLRLTDYNSRRHLVSK